MAEHPNAETVRQLYALIEAKDLDALQDLIEPDASWYVPGRSPVAGTYSGHEAILSYLRQLDERSEGTFTAHLHAAVADDSHTIAIARANATRNGTDFESVYYLACHMRAGRIADIRQVHEDQYGFDKFWA